MRFWDSSAVVPLLVEQGETSTVRALYNADPMMVAWWGTVVECVSAVTRLRRMGALDAGGAAQARARLDAIGATWIQVEPSEKVRSSACTLLTRNVLTSGDAFQLAAALNGPSAADGRIEFVCLDRRLRQGAEAEGFTVLPAQAAEQERRK